MLALLLVCLAAEPTTRAFVGARLHPVDGPSIANGVLVIRAGKILAVGGPETAIPADAQRIDVTGKVIIPGLVDTHSHIGIFGRPGVSANADGNEGSGPVQSSLRALDAINPQDASFRIALAGGVTTANIMPGSGNVIGGQTLYVKLRGERIEEMAISPEGVLGGLKMANGENPKSFNFLRNKMPPATRMRLAALQREQFLKAREYLTKRQAWAKDKTGPEPDRDLALEPLAEVLQRRRTVHFHCHRADDILSALRLAREFDFEIVLQHATDGHRVAKQLAEAKASVSLTLPDSPGGKLEIAGLLEENAAILVKAGVRVAINTDDPVTESRFYLRTGAIALRGGLSEAQALRCLTLDPAAMLHLDKRLGSLTVGKDADFVILSGPPFSVYTQVLETWIDGVKCFDRSSDRDWTYQAGGFALPDGAGLPPRPALTQPLPLVEAPALPKESTLFKEGDKAFVVLAGRVHPISGPPIAPGYVHVADGKIVSVGPLDKAPRDLPVLTAAVVTPGLIDAHCCVGLSGASNTPADQDQDEKTDPNQADLRVLDGFNPDETLVEFFRRQGVTVVHVVPGPANVIAGQTAVFRLRGYDAETMTIQSPAGLLVNLGEVPKSTYPGRLPTTRMGTAALVRTAFSKAASGSDPKSAALKLALQRKIPVLFTAHRQDDIQTALRIAREFKLDARLEMGTEAYRLTDELLRAKVPVVLHPPMQRLAGSLETLHSQLTTPRVLATAKIPFAIGTGFEAYVPKSRVVRYEAAMAAANGLGHEAALRAITLDAAKLLRIDASHGSLEKGKTADLVLYDGDCFEHATQVTATFIGGQRVWDRAAYVKLPFARRAIPLSGAGGIGCCLEW
ncbi:MAG: amidohydrolase family protein [Gemmataceae bacterium]